ncbi:hypothetical protein K443DRAFT_125036 [Laccaria amethystina LaAM-08-1]|uniref:Uncharacterized protein n=1 Tax=Laccaria amethystina LaAM-08-1 TaxID=1095629 RepID=A0A0C9WJL7_9AGAR|nr:hypothetical protein K443DRAFT_125036 [Laccaria amethystina LaAM-08-1]
MANKAKETCEGHSRALCLDAALRAGPRRRMQVYTSMDIESSGRIRIIFLKCLLGSGPTTDQGCENVNTRNYSLNGPLSSIPVLKTESQTDIMTREKTIVSVGVTASSSHHDIRDFLLSVPTEELGKYGSSQNGEQRDRWITSATTTWSGDEGGSEKGFNA